jgi:hypothetical protein
VSELKRTLCHIDLTEPGVTLSHPNNHRNKGTAPNPIVTAKTCLRASVRAAIDESSTLLFLRKKGHRRFANWISAQKKVA